MNPWAKVALASMFIFAAGMLVGFKISGDNAKKLAEAQQQARACVNAVDSAWQSLQRDRDFMKGILVYSTPTAQKMMAPTALSDRVQTAINDMTQRIESFLTTATGCPGFQQQ